MKFDTNFAQSLDIHEHEMNSSFSSDPGKAEQCLFILFYFLSQIPLKSLSFPINVANLKSHSFC